MVRITSKRIASLAAEVLSDPNASARELSLAGSVLSQTELPDDTTEPVGAEGRMVRADHGKMAWAYFAVRQAVEGWAEDMDATLDKNRTAEIVSELVAHGQKNHGKGFRVGLQRKAEALIQA